MRSISGNLRGLVKIAGSKIFPVRIAYVWGMVFVAIVFYAFAWFVNIWWIWTFIEVFESSITLPAPFDSVVELIKYVLAVHPIFALVGWLLWGIRNSMRRDVRSFEY